MDKIRMTLDKKLHDNNKKHVQEFYMLNTDEERVIYTIKLLQQYEMPTIVITNEKNVEKSIEYKNKANELYTTPKKIASLPLNQIVELYTMSVVYAPPKSLELSLVYANRSAALFASRLYNECLVDIDHALELDYPDDLKAKLYARKARCFKMLGDNTSTEFFDAYDKAREWLPKMKNSCGFRDIIKMTLSTIPNKSSEKQRIILDDERNLPIIPNDNSEIPGASSAIAINYNEKFGRHIVATRDIEPGEILSAQQNYCWILHPNKYYTHCWNCSRQTWYGIPCDHCVDVIYCSKKCRDEAWNRYHDIECQVIGPLKAVEMPYLALLALRMAVKAAREAGSVEALMNKILSLDLCTDERTRGFVDNIFDHQKYESVYSLARNTEKRSVPDLFGRSLNSFYMTFMLATRSEMFGKKLNGDLDELAENKVVTFIGGLILRHHQIVPSNVHAMSEERTVGAPIDRGAALMPFLSLFNHNCTSMVNRKSFGKTMVLYSERMIRKGQQIFDNYGMFYALQSRRDRQRELLHQYYFLCNCIACNEDWPLYANIPSYKTQRLSKTAIKKIEKAFKNYYLYVELATNDDVENKPRMMEELTEMVRCICLYARLPCIELNNVVETLKRITALRGSRWQSLE